MIRIGIRMSLNYEEANRVCDVFDVEAAFLTDIEMYVEWPKGSVELGILTEVKYAKYCIQLLKSQYGNVDAALRWPKTFTKLSIAMGMSHSPW